MVRAVVVSLVTACLASGCLDVDAVECGDKICAPGDVCYGGNRCLLPQQFEVCQGLTDGTPCMFPGVSDAVCHGGVCFARGCGDDIVTAPEDCEPAIDVTMRCTDLGFQDDGPVTCSDTCRFVLDACTGYCGDGHIGGFEACDAGQPGDAPDLGGLDCLDFGFYAADGLACTPGYCTFSTASCHGGRCGDGTINGPELCEPTLPSTAACVDVGYDAGRIGCSDICAYDTSTCRLTNWHEVPSPTSSYVYAVWSASDTDVWAVGASGLFKHWDGVGWTKTPIAESHRLKGVWGAAANDVWAVGEAGTIYHYDGTTWTLRTSPVSTELDGVWGTATNNIWAVGDAGTLLHYDGANWTNVSATLGAGTRDVLAIGGLGAGDVWAVGGTTDTSTGTTRATAGFVAHYTNGTWTEIDPGVVEQWRGVYVRAAGDVIIVGTSLNLVAATPGSSSPIRHLSGGTWRDDDITTTHFFNAVGEYGTGEVVAVSNGGSIAHYDGRSWLVVDSGTDQDLHGVSAVGTRAWAVGESGTLVRIDGNDLVGRVPSPAPSSIDLFATHGSSKNDVWIAGRDGFMAHFDGAAWTVPRISLTAPNLPAKSELISLWTAPNFAIAVGTYTDAAGNTIGASACELRGPATAPTSFTCIKVPGPAGVITRALLGIWGTSPTDLWAVGDRGRVVHYDGATWTDHTADIPVLLIPFKDIYGIDTDHLFAVGGNGEVARYVSGTWTVTTPSSAGLIGAWGTAINDMWFVGASGVIAHDTGTWSEIDSGTPEQLIEIHGDGPHVLATGRNGALVERRGNEWSPVRSPLAIDLNGVLVSGNTAIFVGDTGKVFEYRWQ